MMDSTIYAFFFAIMSTIIGSFGALFFKYYSNSSNNKKLFSFFNIYLYLGFLYYGISALIYVFALKFVDLSTIYPVAGLNYVWVMLLSAKFLKEKVNVLKLFGLIFIIAGVILIGFTQYS
jgi:multidrug transporter EmrE-like cation transporter